MKNFKFFQQEVTENVPENNVLWERIDYLQDENERLEEIIKEYLLTCD
jgi:hypothetical protein